MDCIFCKIAKKIIPAKIITETKNSIAFLDVFPLARGHTLVIPKNHYEKVQDMTNDDNTDLFNTVQSTISMVDKITGSTLLAVHNGKDSGQEIPHVHVHLIPRELSPVDESLFLVGQVTIKYTLEDVALGVKFNVKISV